ncbi:MAG: capsular biosynthesis protein [Prevotella sp.]|nr:capsular biosynthesis protein [Prevotella sp.]
MLNFFKKSLVRSGVFNGFTDYHSHILPGVDDGIKTMESSLEVLAHYEEIGIKEVWLTPHIMEDIPNTTSALRERFEELKEAYHGTITLHLASENMLDALFEERLDNGDLLPMGPRGDHLLVETSYFSPPMDLYGILDKIMHKGIRPILAHPERYVYMDKADYQRLKEMGVKFQINITSLVGAYGKEAKDKAEMMLKEKWVDLTGTDVHKLHAIQFAGNQKVLKKTTIKQLCEIHSQKPL